MLKLDKNAKRLAALLMALNMLAAAGCSQTTSDEAEGETKAAAEDTAQAAAETEPEETEPSIYDITGVPEGTTYNGWTFNALVFANQSWGRCQMVVEDLTGETLNDAYYNRNLEVEELLEIKITENPQHHESLVSEFTRSVQAQDNAYSAGWLRQRDAASCAMKGACIDLNILSIDLSQPWWDYHSIETTTMGGKNYLVASEISIADKEAIWPVYFNKEILAEQQMENPYELVDNGTWTFDKLHEMADQALTDLNGDGVISLDYDQYGYATHEENYAASWMACGERLVGINEEGLPYAAFETERFLDVWNKTITAMHAESCYWKQIGKNGWVFSQGRSLFLNEVIAGMEYMRTYEFDFGVLPLPKYDENQESYYTYVAEGSALMIVPKTVDDMDRLSHTLEILGHTGREQILPAYKETCIKTRNTRDEESGRMLEICFNTRCYDLGVMFDWGGLVMTLKGGPENATTVITKKAVMVKTIMAKAFKELGIEVAQ